jgi:hypothetical protein
MMKWLVILLTLLLVFPAVFAGNGGDQCRNINGNATVQGNQDTCEFNGDVYLFCISQRIRGSINGTWVSYIQEDWGVPLEAPAFPIPDGTPFVEYARELEVFNSKQGMVWGDSQFVIDYRAFESGGGVSLPIIVTGGTGIYEDAQGWITATVLDDVFEDFSIQGRVCGPNIPSD